jgi:hypothetical protein
MEIPAFGAKNVADTPAAAGPRGTTACAPQWVSAGEALELPTGCIGGSPPADAVPGDTILGFPPPLRRAAGEREREVEREVERGR